MPDCGVLPGSRASVGGGETVFRYESEPGRTVYEVVRRPGKRFVQRRPGPDGSPIYDLDGVDRIPYRLPELRQAIAADPDGWVLVLEGEKDVERARSLGLVATTSAQGAGWHWPDEWCRYFDRAMRVGVIADNDEPGKRCAQERAELLASSAPDVRLIEALPGVGPGGDFSDLCDAMKREGVSDDEMAKRVRALLEGAQRVERARARPAADPDPPAVPGPAPANGKNGGSDKLRSHLQNLEDTGSLEVFHDASGDAYATLQGPDFGGRRTYLIASKEFERAMRRSLYARSSEGFLGGATITAQTWSDACMALEAEAGGRREREVALRVATRPGMIFLDLGDQTGRVVEVTSDGWQVVEESAVRFRRSSHGRPLPEPTPGGSVDQLREYLHLEDEGWALALLWILGALGGRAPYNVLNLRGEQGSAKTTTGRFIRQLVDPVKGPLRALPKDERDLAIAAECNYVLGFDNLSAIDQGTSDALCRIANGEGFATRKLYTDNAEAVFEGARPVLLTGITVAARAPDLLDRSLIAECSPIPDAERRDEGEMRDAFDRDKPAILGALLDAMVLGLAGERHVRLDPPPRQVASARFAVACEPSLGVAPGSIERALRSTRESTVASVLEESPIAQALLVLLEPGASIEVTYAELLAKLNDRRGEETKAPRSWPATPRALSGAIDRIRPALRKAGITIDDLGQRGSSRNRVKRITRAAEPEPTSPAADGSRAVDDR